MTTTKPDRDRHLTVHTHDVEYLELRLWQDCKAPPELYVRWQPYGRSGTPMVILAPDSFGHVWITLVATTELRAVYHFVRIDSVAEIADLVTAYPCEGDRVLLKGWLADGLDDQIRRLFGS